MNTDVRQISNRIALGSALVFALVLFGFLLTFYIQKEEAETNRWVVHTYQVIDQLKDFNNQLADAETGVRGYTLTQKTPFLEPHQQLKDSLPVRIDRLMRMVEDNRSQQRHTVYLRRLIESRLIIFDSTIADSRQGGRRQIMPWVEQGRQKSQQIREWIAMMIKAENSLLKSRTDAANAIYLRANLLSAGLLAFTFVTLFFAYRRLREELERRERNEAQLMAYEVKLQKNIKELERSNDELQRFAYVASHDLQEPLRKIQTYLSLINDSHPDAIGEEIKPYFTRIRQAAERSSNLIRDLLTYSRVSYQTEKFQLVDLANLVAELLDELEVPISEGQAEVEIGALPEVEAMPGHMRHLFQNLLSNALKYRKPDVAPRIRVEARSVEESGQAQYEITVSDNGIGFDEKYAEQIFEPFQRLHNGSVYKGTGIGLAICKKVAESHGGSIRAASQPGKGARFMVRLPVRKGVSSE